MFSPLSRGFLLSRAYFTSQVRFVIICMVDCYYKDVEMRKSLLVALGVVVLSGCAGQNDDYQLNSKQSSTQKDSKEWKEFVAPLSTKTQSPQDRLMKRAERNY